MTPPRERMSAYRKVQVDNKKDERRKRRPVPQSQTALVGKCGAKRRGKGKGSVCQKPAGWGTSHVGFGKCRFHGGSMPTHIAAAAKNRAIQFMGAPKDISPLDAIIWCIKITAGEVEWLSLEIEKVSRQDWFEHTVIGRQMNVLVQARNAAQDRLVKYSKDAIALGLAERAVRLAEQYGHSIAKLLEGIKNDLELTTAQQKKWPITVRKHLILLEGGNVVEHKDREQPLVAIPARTGDAR